MMIFGDCVQTVRCRYRQFRIQLQPREQIVEVPIVLHFEQLVENSQLEAVVQVHRVDVQYVVKECSSSHGGER